MFVKVEGNTLRLLTTAECQDNKKGVFYIHICRMLQDFSELSSWTSLKVICCCLCRDRRAEGREGGGGGGGTCPPNIFRVVKS